MALRKTLTVIFILLGASEFLGASFFGNFNEDIRDLVGRQFGIDKLSISIEQDMVLEQETNYPSERNFNSALVGALNSFLADHSDIESPLALAIHLAYEQSDAPYTRTPSKRILDHANSLLSNFLNSHNSSLLIFDQKESGDTPRAWPPEYGESLAENWIFVLTIPNLSDHIFWAIVPRDLQGKIYNYGFN